MNGEKSADRFWGGIKRSLAVSLWFMVLTFPIMVIKVNTVEHKIDWRWMNMVGLGVGIFALSFLWRWLMEKKEAGQKKRALGEVEEKPFFKRILDVRRNRILVFAAAAAAALLLMAVAPELRGYQTLITVGVVVLVLIRLAGVDAYNTATIAAVALFALAFPVLFSIYQVNIMTTALIYVVLGLGLNIVVGTAGLLVLGYAAFYAVGAYTYALLNMHYNVGFWVALPLGGLLAMLFGILLGFPVLRLRGDYLAIVTLGFGEIVRLVLENWNEFSQGPSGIANISRPYLLGYVPSLSGYLIFFFYLMIVLTLLTVFVVNRLQNSRLGRAWLALREDEIACQAMGIDVTRTKLAAFALSAFWAGLAGVVFAAKTTFVNPASFTFLESALILSIVVLGGMGSIVGVIIGSFIIILLPEYFRAFADYRMLLFGAALVLVMVFRPGGMIQTVRRKYEFQAADEAGHGK